MNLLFMFFGLSEDECTRFVVKLKGHFLESCVLGEEVEGRTRATKDVVADHIAEMLQEDTLLIDKVELSEEIV